MAAAASRRATSRHRIPSGSADARGRGAARNRVGRRPPHILKLHSAEGVLPDREPTEAAPLTRAARRPPGHRARGREGAQANPQRRGTTDGGLLESGPYSRGPASATDPFSARSRPLDAINDQASTRSFRANDGFHVSSQFSSRDSRSELGRDAVWWAWETSHLSVGANG
jgi:hypothetical protein